MGLNFNKASDGHNLTWVPDPADRNLGYRMKERHGDSWSPAGVGWKQALEPDRPAEVDTLAYLKPRADNFLSFLHIKKNHLQLIGLN